MDRPHRMGQPVRRAGLMALVLLAAIPAGCDSEQSQEHDTGHAPVTGPAEEARNAAKEALPPSQTAISDKAKRKSALEALGQAMREPKREIRVIGKGNLPVPPIPEDGLVRISPAERAAEKNARQKARLPKKPDLFPRPIVVRAGELRSGETLIRLAGINPVPRERRCQTPDGEWPCGNFARAALQRFIRTRTIACTNMTGDGERFSGECRIGNTDLSRWLVTQGWATASDSALKDMEEAAREAGKGIWKNRKPSF